LSRNIYTPVTDLLSFVKLDDQGFLKDPCRWHLQIRNEQIYALTSQQKIALYIL